jgi:uncharacterized protein (DUF1330 family)
MASLQWTSAGLQELSSRVPDGEPVVMLNLLRYRDSVGAGKNDPTGRQSYEHYFQATLPILMEVGGRPLWRGQVRFPLVGPKDERWDEAILVGYPTRSAFERMVNDARHEPEVAFRTAALEDSRMIAIVMPEMIGGFAWWTSKISAGFRRNGERIGVVHGKT